MAQDALNNIHAPSNVNRMMETEEGEKGAYNGVKCGLGYGNKTNNGNGNYQNKPQNPGPLPCKHKVVPTSEKLQNQ